MAPNDKNEIKEDYNLNSFFKKLDHATDVLIKIMTPKRLVYFDVKAINDKQNLVSKDISEKRLYMLCTVISCILMGILILLVCYFVSIFSSINEFYEDYLPEASTSRSNI